MGGFGARKDCDQTSVLAMSLAVQGRAEGGLWSEEGRSGEEEEGQREREAVRNCRQANGPFLAGEAAEAQRGSPTCPGHTADEQGSGAANPPQPGPRAQLFPASCLPLVLRGMNQFCSGARTLGCFLPLIPLPFGLVPQGLRCRDPKLCSGPTGKVGSAGP